MLIEFSCRFSEPPGNTLRMPQTIRRTTNIGLALGLLGLLAGTALGQGTLDCGKYPTASTSSGTFCRRVGVLPWFAGIPGSWDTELRLGANGDNVSFSWVSSLSLTSFTTDLVVENNGVLTSFEAESGINLDHYKSHWIRILGQCAPIGPCGLYNATGSMLVTADASSAAAFEGVSASGVYRYTSNGSVVSQTTAPVIFLDQATARWSAIILETPRDLQSQPDATITSFAVANLSPDPQAVLIRVYDERGNLSASAKTPVLDKATGFSGSTQTWVGGIYADTLSNVLGINLPASECSQCQSPSVFRGTVVFEGENGGLIAPVVFRFNGPAMTTVPVTAKAQ
jgi:hypothetical protein